MSERSRHRDAILARRALYLTTALSALGCPSRDEPPTDPVETAATARTHGKRQKKKEATLPANTPWAEVIAKAPPLEVPKEAALRERAHLEAQKTRTKAQYDAIAAVWTKTPGCDPAASTCNDWRELAALAQTMFRAIEGPFSFGPCGGANGTTDFVLARRRAHQAYVDALLKQVEAHLEKLALHYGADGADAWAGMVKEAKEPPPRPCLSPCPMPELQDILVSVRFAKGSATLDLGDRPVLVALGRVRDEHKTQSHKSVLVVRGHADPSEPEPDKLALERAQAVVDWLVKNGVSPADVSATSMGGALLIEASAGPSGGAVNRRVDFEVVER